MTGSWTYTSADHIYTYSFDGITQDQRNRVLPRILESNGQTISDVGANVLLRQTYTVEASSGPAGHHPEIVEDVYGRKYFIVEPDRYIPEPAAMYVISFSLSMMARYFPDVWMERIEREIRTREFLDYLLNLFHRTFPNLLLDQLTRTKYHVHPE